MTARSLFAMRRSALLCCGLALALAGAAHGGPKRAAGPERGKKMSMTLTSSAFKPNAYIPRKHSCDGEDVSPELAWAGLPFGVKSLALVLDDPDAPAGGWVHWVLFDIPPAPPGLKENVAKEKTLSDGSRHGLSWGVDGGKYSRIGYYGPCPPPGAQHRYIFKLYALNKVLGLPAGIGKEDLLKAMEGHILARAELTGLYKR